ncbi:hypothetical protein HQ393_00775 [Chitinibacter bivalviorum]|uniref:Acid-shock protein n=1 Tax=Chitinibacter bivalviorum TaxID=2739434 RepID=A0A7H9BFC2_9NEIS|nr:hypothetical protein [Chitinibacter bivalviorum]QLG86888.1 hypothetical protein HQ393_00775 [Chitinibacter bivalviorum]
MSFTTKAVIAVVVAAFALPAFAETNNTDAAKEAKAKQNTKIEKASSTMKAKKHKASHAMNAEDAAKAKDATK